MRICIKLKQMYTACPHRYQTTEIRLLLATDLLKNEKLKLLAASWNLTNEYSEQSTTDRNKLCIMCADEDPDYVQ